jgi:hypothetical protein
MAKGNITVSLKLDNKQIRKDYTKFQKLYVASKELLSNYDHWLKTGEVANKRVSKRLYTNLKKALDNLDVKD